LPGDFRYPVERFSSNGSNDHALHGFLYLSDGRSIQMDNHLSFGLGFTG
jgi:hypothetical protein